MMTSKLQQAINLAQTLSRAEQLELLKALSILIEQTPSLENQAMPEAATDFSTESFRTSWQQAVAGQTLPLSKLWEDIDVD